MRYKFAVSSSASCDRRPPKAFSYLAAFCNGRRGSSPGFIGGWKRQSLVWKVTRVDDPSGHVLWVLGNHSPLPKKLAWKSREVEQAIAASQEVLAPPSINASVGPLGGITLLPSLIGIRDNPDDARLEDRVPAELYARWLALKARYLGRRDAVERWRPIFAADELYRAALAQSGLVPYEGVWPQVENMARRARVP